MCHKVALKSSLTALENLAWISGRDKNESLIKALEDMGLAEKKCFMRVNYLWANKEN